MSKDKFTTSQSDKIRNDVLSEIAHNINTPLNGLTGLIYLMENHLDDKERLKKYLQRMKMEVNELISLTEAVYNHSEKKLTREICDIFPEERQHFHCMIAEDNLLNAEILMQILKDMKNTFVWVHNGKEAVECFQKSDCNEFDVILMDLQMPVMNGFEAVQQIRSLKRRDAKTVRIYACSANTLEKDREKAISSGMDGFLAKPVDVNRLIDLLYEKEK